MIGKNQCQHGQLARSCEICELELENKELRAWLARCVDELENYSRNLHTMCRRGSTKDPGVLAVAMEIDELTVTLPEQAKSDADVLRCAEETYEMHQRRGVHEESYNCALCKAVQAAKEGNEHKI